MEFKTKTKLGVTFSLGPITPNVYAYYGPPVLISHPSNWAQNGMPSYLASGNLLGGAGNYYNYYNGLDFALNWPSWELNQQVKPGLGWYGYDKLGDQFYRDSFWQNPTMLTFPLNTYEIFSYAAQSDSIALGRGPVGGGASTIVSRGVIYKNVDLGKSQYGYGGAHKWHSGQFRGMNMERRQYWKRLLISFGLREEDVI